MSEPAAPPDPRCPTAMELEAFLDDPRADTPIARHLDGCATCEAAAEEIVANNRLAARLRASATGSGGGDAVRPDAGGARGNPIDGYEILDEVQRGSQGIVHRARQAATNRVVALKLLLAGTFATSQQRRRFEREIELLAGLEHPNIVTIHDSGTTTGGDLYLVMQYIEGQPLTEWTRRRHDADHARPAAGLRGVLELYEGICDGVSWAHQHGVIHRDLKPANVIVDTQGRPHILDFGLARPIGEAAAAAIEVTEAGSFLGTLAYAAPEQTRADATTVDVRADVYSLGVLLYEMITGRYPYPMEGDLAQILRSITDTPPTPPSAWRRSADPGPAPYRIGDELDTIVLTALNKDPERRYQSAAALRDDLRRYLDGAPIEAKKDSGWYVFRKTVTRHRVPFAIAGLFAALLVVFTSVVLVKNHRINIENEKLREINVFLEDTLGSVHPARPGDDVVVRELLDEAVQWIDMALADQPEVAATIRMTVGNSYRGLGRLDDAEAQLERSLRTRLELHGERHPDVARSLNALALLRRDQGRYLEAERLFADAIALRRDLLGLRSIDVSYSLASFAGMRLRQGRYIEARTLLEESLDIRRGIYGPKHQDVAMCLFTLARIADARGDTERAERLHREALDIRRDVLSDQHPDLARSLEALGSLLARQGDGEEAVDLLDECLEVRSRFLSAEHWQVARTRAVLGGVLAESGAYERAEPLLVDAERRLREVLGAADDRVRQARRHLATVYEATGRPARAAEFRESP
ncbi:MAG: serine/threonine protein kinase [Planctomycetes bacterium]|nr:serine/threonine protein kinase [Planctomycetota bacterium]